MTEDTLKAELAEKASNLKGKQRGIADTLLSCAYQKGYGFVANTPILDSLYAFIIAGAKPHDILPTGGDVYRTIAVFIW